MDILDQSLFYYFWEERTNPKKFDVCIASAVLYYMCHPVELIALAAKAFD